MPQLVNGSEGDDLATLARTHAGDPQGLADALVAAARPDREGYRDDATAIAVAMTAGSPQPT